MNSVIFTYVTASLQRPFPLGVALDRLGAWLDAEIGAFANLPDISAGAAQVIAMGDTFRAHGSLRFVRCSVLAIARYTGHRTLDSGR